MARASTETLVSLDTFARIFGINPIHFNQVQIIGLMESAVCDSPLIQHAWQDADRASREEIATAIADAERLFSETVGFKIAPAWEDETVPYYRPARPELISNSIRDVRGFYNSISANWKYLIEGGQRATTLIINAPVVYSDADADTYFETATILAATTVTDPEEIKIFYPGKAGDTTYEIRPITVTIAGGIATITCRRELLVNLDLQESLDANAVDGLIDANFLSTVDVYRVYNDPSVQGRLIWIGTTGCGTCTACTKSYQNACLNIDNAQIGSVKVEPAEWDAVDLEFDPSALSACRAPDSIRLWYRAGWQYKNSKINVDPLWERVICYLAAAQLHRCPCGCKSVTNYIEYWQEDLALRQASPSGSVSYNFNSKQFENPFGTRRGHIYAWRYAQRYLGGSVNA